MTREEPEPYNVTEPDFDEITLIANPTEKQKLCMEKLELDEKIKELVAVVASDDFGNIELLKRGRLLRQASIMREYSRILKERIEN